MESICFRRFRLMPAKTFHLDQYQFLALPITTAATYAMAAASWNVLEKPFLRLKRFFEARTIRPDQSTVGS